MKKYVFSFLFIVSAIYSSAQSSIRGTVRDEASKPVAGASVYLLNTGRGAVSNSTGYFEVKDIQPGTYTMEVSAIGFSSRYKKLVVQKETITVDATLEQAARGLDNVVVTAQKWEEMVQSLPLSITALSAKKAEAYRLWNSKDLTAIVPNLYAAEPGDKRNVTAIRGIATTSYDPAVATYIDGVNQFNLDTYISPLFDIERIEVLRGPQGTLYGRNAMGGVINIITKQPENKSGGFAEVNIGNKGTQRYSVGVRVPLKKTSCGLALPVCMKAGTAFTPMSSITANTISSTL